MFHLTIFKAVTLQVTLQLKRVIHSLAILASITAKIQLITVQALHGAKAAADELGIPVTLDWADYDSPLLSYDYSFTLTACYKKISEVKGKDTYTVKVENGIGSGTYTDGSNVTVTADPAPKGKVFDKWEVKSNTKGVKDKKVNISSNKIFNEPSC